MLYPLPNVTDFVAFLQWINGIVPMGELIVLAAFALSFITLKRYGSESAFVSSMFFSTIIAVLLVALRILPADWLTFFLIGTAVSAMLIKRQ